MKNDKNMDVVDWRDTPRDIVSRTRAPRQLWSPTVIGVLGTILLHSLVVPSALLGSKGRQTHPPELREASARLKSSVDAEEGLVLITLPTIANSTREDVQVISSLPTLSKLTAVVPVNPDPPALLNIEILTLGEEQASQSTADAGDGAEQARLFGIYTGQIQARIERIWRRPRSPVNENASPVAPATDESFQCQAQIVQDAKGSVLEILLLRCSGSLAWQRSLVTAIQQASPLPAPPSASVFSHSITLNFLALAYVPGSPDDDYEIAPVEVAQMIEGSHRSSVSADPKQSRPVPGDSLGSHN
jgi:hypothetical protein